jgi:hypothetical protein
MGKFTGWIAAVGGLLTILAVAINFGAWAYWVGGALAIIFGIWANFE